MMNKHYLAPVQYLCQPLELAEQGGFPGTGTRGRRALALKMGIEHGHFCAGALSDLHNSFTASCQLLPPSVGSNFTLPWLQSSSRQANISHCHHAAA